MDVAEIQALPELLGLEKAEAQLSRAVEIGTLPSAYLLTGCEGIGKATLGLKLAASLLAPASVMEEEGGSLFGDLLPAVPATPGKLHYDSTAPAFKRMLNHSHPDFLWIRPPYDEKKKAFKRDIPIEHIRKIGEFMALTSGEGGWKIILIDPAEAMNHNAANALLKWLEEPSPRSLFILISHAPGRLLPTILSRCRRLEIRSPDSQHYYQLLEGQEEKQALSQLYRFTSGSIGMSAKWLETAWKQHWDGMLSLANTPEPLKATLLQLLAEAIAKDEHFSQAYFQRMMDSLLARVAMYQATGIIENLADSDKEAEAIMALAARHQASYILETHEWIRHFLEEAGMFYLDKRHVIITILGRL